MRVVNVQTKWVQEEPERAYSCHCLVHMTLMVMEQGVWDLPSRHPMLRWRDCPEAISGIVDLGWRYWSNHPRGRTRHLFTRVFRPRSFRRQFPRSGLERNGGSIHRSTSLHSTWPWVGRGKSAAQISPLQNLSFALNATLTWGIKKLAAPFVRFVHSYQSVGSIDLLWPHRSEWRPRRVQLRRWVLRRERWYLRLYRTELGGIRGLSFNYEETRHEEGKDDHFIHGIVLWKQRMLNPGRGHAWLSRKRI